MDDLGVIHLSGSKGHAVDGLTGCDRGSAASGDRLLRRAQGTRRGGGARDAER
jgi:hypothetical protein